MELKTESPSQEDVCFVLHDSIFFSKKSENLSFGQCDQMVWLFFNIGPFATMKISSMMSQIRQSMLSILTNKKLLIILPKACKLLPN